MTESDTDRTTGSGPVDRPVADRHSERDVSRRTVLKAGAVGAIVASVGVRALPEGPLLGGSYSGEGPPPIDGSKPTDPDGDGLYEDVNGNEDLDLADVVTFVENIDESEIEDYPEYYDFSGNGDVDVADAVELFDEITE